MGKRMLSLCMALALCLGLLPATALAAEGHSHPVCVSAENCTDPGHASGHTAVEWTGTGTLPTTAGNYYLTADVTLTSTWTVPPGETQLCLNGHSITYSGEIQGSVIKVPENAALTVTDCQSNPGKITGGTGTRDDSYDTSLFQGGHYGGGILVQGTLNLYGGSIEGNRIPTPGGSDDDGGGGVFVDGGDSETNESPSAAFNMYGGTIKDNAADYGGTGVLCRNATFNMYGGTITENAPKDNGQYFSGGVCLDDCSSMTMTGGEIYGNPTNNGQIYVTYGAELTVEGKNAVIGKETDSGSLYLFHGGKAEIKSGAINAEVAVLQNRIDSTTNTLVDKTELTVSGGTLADDVRVKRGANLIVSGGEIKGKVTVGSEDSDYYGWSTITLSGNPEISSISLLNDENVITIDGQLTYQDPIPVTKANGGTITKGWDTYMSDKTPEDYFVSAGDYQVRQEDEELYLASPGTHTHEGTTEFKQDLNFIEPNQQGIYCITPGSDLNYFLSSDLTIGDRSSIDPTLYIGDGTNEITVNLCLNGYELTRPEGASVTGPVIIVRENATLNIYDCKGTSTITGGTGRTAEKDGETYSYGGGILVYGTLNLYGGSITENSAEAEGVAGGFGGGVYVAPDGSFTMSGGSVTDNEAETSGGGVTVAGTGDAVPVSKPITEPVSIGGGGSDGVIDEWKDGGTVEGDAELQILSRTARAPRNGSAASFTLTGGSITGNTAGEYGGGVNVRGSVSVNTGSVITVTGNTVNQVTNNVYFPEAHTDLTVNGIPASGSEIGVRMETPGQFAAMGTSIGEAQAKPFFTSDDTAYNVLTMEGGLKLGKQQGTPSISIDYQNETLTGFESGADYTIDGVTVTPGADSTITIQEDWFNKTISIVHKGDGNMADSEAQSLTIPARPAAPTGITGGTNQISGLNATMEYSTDGKNWTKVNAADLNNGVLSNLEAGEYQVRFAATNSAFASDPVTVTVTQYSPPANPNYKITIEDTEHGTVTAPTSAKQGTEVTLTPTPDEGFDVGTVTVTDRFGDAVEVTENPDGTYTFTMPNGQVTVEVTFVESQPEPLPFTDVAESDWFYDAVRYAYENGLMGGIGDNLFAPNHPTTRAQLVTILYRLEGEPAVTGQSGFTDVEPDTWYTDAVTWAAEEGVVNGVSETQFAPGNNITREQLATILFRYAQAKGYDVSPRADLSGFPDAGDILPYAQEAMAWAVAEGLLQGFEDDTLRPQGNATRAQIATILMRFCEGVVE